MDKEKYIDNILKKTRICQGRRWYKRKLFTHFVWNLYHPDNPVKKGEVIHHKNEDILDDYINNLEKMKVSEHITFHHKNKVVGIKTKEKMSKAQSGSKNPMYGKKHTEETREKLSETHKGKIFSKGTKEKLSRAKKGSKNPNYGKTLSKETREKMSKAQKRRRQLEATKRKMST